VAHGALVDVEDAMKNNVLLLTCEFVTEMVDRKEKISSHERM
jgi:hypothetical protein